MKGEPKTGVGMCGETCPLSVSIVAEESRNWAFSPPQPHEEGPDPRFPNVGVTNMDRAVRCRFRWLTGACTLDSPVEITSER